MAARKKARSRRSPGHPKRSTSRRRRTTSRKNKPSRGRRWSARVTRTSHAMDLKQGVFTGNDPERIATSVLNSARRSHTRKSSPYRSAMSMINFYINRGGKGLSAAKRAVLERAKDALRRKAGRSRKA